MSSIPHLANGQGMDTTVSSWDGFLSKLKSVGVYRTFAQIEGHPFSR